MVPSKTIERIGSTIYAATRRADPDGDYRISGTDLNDLLALAQRFNYSGWNDPDENRDWQNRLSLLVSNASEIKQERDVSRFNPDDTTRED